MIDIHTHIIPFVDDGSRSIEDSIEMIKRDMSFGIDTIVATPHHITHKYTKSVQEIKENFDLLVNEVKKQNIDVKLLLGQEICYTSRVDLLDMLEKGELLTINNTKYILLEFKFQNEPDDVGEILYNFASRGYKVIVAHVERYDWITVDKVMRMKEEGALIQVNSDSICGLTTFKEKRFVKKILKAKLVDLVASDMHSFRPSNMDKALKKVNDTRLFNFDFEATK